MVVKKNGPDVLDAQLMFILSELILQRNLIKLLNTSLEIFKVVEGSFKNKMLCGQN